MNLSIKNVPEPLVRQLRQRASEHHRSLQGELLAILEETVAPPRLRADQVHARVNALDLRTSDNAARIIREDRDAR